MSDRTRVLATMLLTSTGLLVAGCGERGLEVADAAMHGLLGARVEAVHIPDSAVADLSDSARVPRATVRSVTKSAATTIVWSKVTESLSRLNENTDGPAREVVVETACDSLANGDYRANTIEANLVNNAAVAGLPEPTNYLVLADIVTDDLQEASASTDGHERAAASIMCFVDSKAAS